MTADAHTACTHNKHEQQLDTAAAVAAIEPNNNDVLFGRGNHVNRHAGNLVFRQLCRDNKPRYAQSSKLEKKEVALEIVRKVRGLDPPGRFLKKNREGQWFDVGNNEAREKTSQALRDTNKMCVDGSMGMVRDDLNAYNKSSSSTCTSAKKKKHHRRKQTAPGRIQTNGLGLGGGGGLAGPMMFDGGGGGMNRIFAMPPTGAYPHMNMNMNMNMNYHHPMANMNMHMNMMPMPGAAANANANNMFPMAAAAAMSGWSMPSASHPKNFAGGAAPIPSPNRSSSADKKGNSDQHQQQPKPSQISSSSNGSVFVHIDATTPSHPLPLQQQSSSSSPVSSYSSAAHTDLRHTSSSPPKTKPKRGHSRKRTAPGRIQTDQLFSGIDMEGDLELLKPIPIGSGGLPLQLSGSADVVPSPPSPFSNGRSKTPQTMTLPTTFEEDALHLLPDDWVPPKAAKISSDEPVLDDIYTSSSKQQSRRRNRHERKTTAPGRIETDQLFLGIDDLMNHERIHSNLKGGMDSIPELPWKFSSATSPTQQKRYNHRHRRCSSTGDTFLRSKPDSDTFSFNGLFEMDLIQHGCAGNDVVPPFSHGVVETMEKPKTSSRRRYFNNENVNMPQDNYRPQEIQPIEFDKNVNVKDEHIGANSSFLIDEGDATAWAETCSIILHQDSKLSLGLDGERPELHNRNEAYHGSMSDGLIQVNRNRDSAASFNSLAQNCMLDSILEDREEECDAALIVTATARNSGASSMDADELMHLLSDK